MGQGTPRAHGRDGMAMAILIGTGLAACLAACLVACTPSGAGESRPNPTASSSAPAPSEPVAATPLVEVPVAPAQLPAAAARVDPTRLRIESIGVDMPVTDVGVEANGQMQLPTDPAVAGWYRYGPDAVAAAGRIVLAAHVDAPDYPIGPLAGLRDLGPGAAVTLDGADGSTRTFIVESLNLYEKTSLPTSELFAREGAPALVIITCGGPFDSTTGHYRDNVVAIARPQ